MLVENANLRAFKVNISSIILIPAYILPLTHHPFFFNHNKSHNLIISSCRRRPGNCLLFSLFINVLLAVFLFIRLINRIYLLYLVELYENFVL